MSRMDSAAAAALDGDIRPVFFAFLDFDTDPLRANTSGHTIVFDPPIGNADLDGHVFEGIDPSIVDISPVRSKEGGTDKVTAKLSGIVGLDDELLAIVGDPAKWQGRTAQLWRMIRDANGVQRGAIQHYYTGYMVALSIAGDPTSQTIEVAIEGYLAASSDASNRSYLDQESFDPGDLSARAAIAIANGLNGAPIVASGGGGGGGAGGRSLIDYPDMNPGMYA